MKERIIKEAFKLFWRYGIKSVTMDDIAKDLGISKRTIYQHFPDKEAIVILVIEQELESQKCQMDKMDEDQLNPIEQMVLGADYMRVSLAHMNPVVFHDLKKYHPLAWDLFHQYKHEYITKGIRENLVEGVETGLYRKEINVDMLSILRIEQVLMALDPNIYPADKFNMMNVQMEFVHHFLHGILTEKGFEYYTKYKEESATTFTHEK
ncbi:TetR/AcrR family transcriptional regulator [Dyadobacter sp. CY356]|uniref:TetR/AcrR family transcriptional regulator n=1 Tax=Dyadobacter sp. CY356 TaxID=2906442 RepID=UPI001F3F7D96|nr:TetR/AcrR family transcriptional regulator [Dyadobacter sp. CY356]MCF0056676.1 TetR/AcrR family transcriptional regulator [Dyadobacter sp. CY356]